jgi:hypothetical protein
MIRQADSSTTTDYYEGVRLGDVGFFLKQWGMRYSRYAYSSVPSTLTRAVLVNLSRRKPYCYDVLFQQLRVHSIDMPFGSCFLVFLSCYANDDIVNNVMV